MINSTYDMTRIYEWKTVFVTHQICLFCVNSLFSPAVLRSQTVIVLLWYVPSSTKRHMLKA